MLVKLRVEIVSKLLAQARKGVFSLLPQLLPLSGGRSWWIWRCAVKGARGRRAAQFDFAGVEVLLEAIELQKVG